MRKTGFAAALAVVLVLCPIRAGAETCLIPGGQAIGLRLRDDSLTVAAYDEECPTGGAGLKIGDRIEKIDGTPVTSPEAVRAALEGAGGKAEVTILRGGRRQRVTVPLTEGRLGVYLRQGISGIGTVTFYDPDTGTFAALGHGVSAQGGGLLTLRSGSAYRVGLGPIRRGLAGDPGQLRGEADPAGLLGNLTKNTPQGVFGKLEGPLPGTPLPTADYGSIQTGPATIRCTLDGTGVREYSVEILKIYPESKSNGRNLLLKVTDEALLTQTGGIIQGMSGSPIIQDGKIVGAVTHVLVNDPTRGYGIFIENMLDAAG